MLTAWARLDPHRDTATRRKETLALRLRLTRTAHRVEITGLFYSFAGLVASVLFASSTNAATKVANLSAGISNLPTKAALSDLLSASRWRARSSRRTTPDSMEPPSNPSAKREGVLSRRIVIDGSEPWTADPPGFDWFVIATPMKQNCKKTRRRARHNLH
jgi:hypothetical protein